MADYSSEGNVRVDYVATIAVPTAPDASSELSSTTRLDTKITPDGWSPASDQAEVPTAACRRRSGRRCRAPVAARSS